MRSFPGRCSSTPAWIGRASDRARRSGASLPVTFAYVANELAQRVDPRAAERIGASDRRRQAKRIGDALGDIADVHGLEPRLRAGQRHDRQEAQKAREKIEERILASEDHRRPEDRPIEPGGRHDRLGFALASKVPARARRIGIERAHVDEPAHSRCGARRDHRAREDRRAPSGTCLPSFRSGFRRD